MISLCTPLWGTDKFRLQTVRVIGSHRFQEADLKAALGLQTGTMVDIDMLKQAADRLMQTGVLGGLKYQYVPLSTGIEVEYVVTDSNDFLPCRYDNIVWIDADELTKAVHEKIPLYDGNAPQSGKLLDDVSQAISQVLATHGVATSVRYEMHTPAVGKPIDSVFFVSDSVKPKVREISLPGADFLSQQERAENTKRLIGDDYSTSNIRSSLFNGLSFLYGAKGYVRMSVGEPQPKVVGDPQQGNVSVTVPITQGEQYRWESLTWDGNSAVPSGDLDKVVSFRSGEIVDSVKLDMQLGQVQRTYKRMGYEGIRILRTASYDDQKRTVAYQITVKEGDLFRMGTVQMAGLDPPIVDKLQKNWKLKPGDAFDDQYPAAFVQQNAGLISSHGHAATVDIRAVPTAEKTINVTLNF